MQKITDFSESRFIECSSRKFVHFEFAECSYGVNIIENNNLSNGLNGGKQR